MLEIKIEISSRSQRWIKKYWLARGGRRCELPAISLFVDLTTLISWLNEELMSSIHQSKEKMQKIELMFLSLHTELLNALCFALKGEDIKRDENASQKNKIKFALLTTAGILVAACQGFDGIVTLLSVFTLPSIIILGLGFIFSLFSIAVFCGFDLVKVSNGLGIKLSDSYKLLDTYLLQLQKIKAIGKKMEEYCLAELSQNDLQQLELILSMLQKRFASLVESGKQFDKALNSKHMHMAKTIISNTSALLFFGGGFFAGQSVALFMSAIVFNPVSPTFWPVIIFSVVVGLAALSLYWYVDRPNLNKLVSSWFGLNKEHVKQICDQNLLGKEVKKLANLKEKVISAGKLTNRISQLDQKVRAEERVSDSTEPGKNSDIRMRANFYSFLKASAPSVASQNSDNSVCCNARYF